MNHSKLSVRTLTMLALLTAMSIIFARVFTVSTGFLRFNLGALPTHLAAVWFGPAGGFVVGLVSGLLYRCLHEMRLGLRLQISILAGHLVGSVVINSLALHLFYGYQWALLAARIPNALVLSVVNTLLVRILLENKALTALVRKA